MHNKLPPLPVRILVAVIVIGSLIYFGARSLNPANNGEITASGSIEGTIVNIAPEMAGKVSEVFAEEGQFVKENDPLLNLDPSLLLAQRAVASAQVDSANAALAAAQTKYDQTLQAAFSAQDVSRAKDLRPSAPDQFDQSLWYIEQTQQAESAQGEVDAAKAGLDSALANLNKIITDLNNADYVNAEARLAQARASFLVAKDVKEKAESVAQNGGLMDAAYDYYNTALDELNAAQENFNALTNSKTEDDIEYARGQVVVAQQRYDAAYTRLLALQTGAQSPLVISSLKALEQSKTALAQAEANLALLDTQIAKLTISAPMDGIILTRSVEPGEFIQPGGSALTMADLTQITITVYVPEGRYGNISLGQTAEVRVDSFPDLTFTATVVHIADQAEFTPRNVQTVEGRSSTFYAIKLQVKDQDGKLKIGMPADVVFK